MKLISWNLNGIRAVVKKGLHEKIEALNPDVICFQETKAQDDQVREALFGLDGYHIYSNSAVKKGYSGTAILSKKEPILTRPDIGIDEHDQEGRVLCAEYDDFYLITVYTPNSGNGLKRLDYREQWDKDFVQYLAALKAQKPIVVCGDLNVAHKSIDIKNDKSNYNKTAGYTQTEIDGMDALVNLGLVDTFRHLHPDEEKYSWWSWRGGAREKNIGWRIDYFLISRELQPKLKEAFILNEVEGSDHCPVGIVLN